MKSTDEKSVFETNTQTKTEEKLKILDSLCGVIPPITEEEIVQIKEERLTKQS